MGKDVIVACDFAGEKETLEFLSMFTGRKPFVKIGMELYYSVGPSIVEKIKNRGHKIFLDLKTKPDGSRPILIAVTQLTSTDADTLKNELLINTPMAETVMRYAENAKNSGLDGVVCSPLEAGAVHGRCGEKFLTVTPGVRFADGDIGDQKRVMTPAQAKIEGSDFIVVGRPITAAGDRVEAYERCIKEFVG